ncbi:hypothetical protein SAMN05660420_01411 [Desulfuromusa kysingii]|uniref:Uncharacterized protein n=1 Tax=Desulfuromusa kysingii TaxID=37625 RepID=A0A1H3YX34_9BACT|nr:hypothetical protein SAMN05660420_01411 [Desulfuromusa kysingii]
MESESWEALCNRCGACCFEKKIDRQGNILTTSIPCRFLDIHNRTCRIYAQRLEVEEDCIKLTPEIITEISWLPEECAYRNLIKES